MPRVRPAISQHSNCSPMRAFALLSCLFSCFSTVRAQQPASGEDPAPTILAECQMVLIPEKMALPLIVRLVDETKIESAFADIQALIAEGKAELSANLICRMSDGVKTFSVSGEEVRYSTEYDPPQLPQNAPADPAVLKNWPVIGVTPTSFETRNVGPKIEISASRKQDGKLLSVSGVCEHVRFIRWQKFDAGKLATGELLSIEQPIFHTVKSDMSVLMRSGQRMLMGVHKVPGSASSYEMFFLRVSTASTKTP